MNALFFFAGLIVGAVMLFTQLWTVNHMRPEALASAAAWMLVGVLGRLALVAVLLVAALQRGIVPGLLAGAGLLVSRWAILAWLERADWHLVQD
jgi:hypothetical protein